MHHFAQPQDMWMQTALPQQLADIREHLLRTDVVPADEAVGQHLALTIDRHQAGDARAAVGLPQTLRGIRAEFGPLQGMSMSPM